MILNLMKISLKSLLKNKLRTILTILGIYIGIVSIVLIITISNSAKITIKDKLEQLDTLLVTARIFNTKDINTKKVINKLKEESAINNIAVRMDMEWNDGESIQSSDTDNMQNETRSIEAINIEYFSIYPDIKEKLIYGHVFTSIEENNNLPVCLLREDIANEIYGNSKCIGKYITVNNEKLKIIGIMRNNSENEYDVNYVADLYVLESYIESSNEDYSINEICYIVEPIGIKSREEVYAIVDETIGEFLEKEDYYVEQYLFTTEEASLTIIDIVSIVFIIIAGISVVSGGIGIMNVLLVSVNEKIKEIGIRRALGASKKVIFIQFILEGIFIMLSAGILGIVTNIFLVGIANNIFVDYGLMLVVNIEIIIYTMIFCGFLGILFGLYPAWKASRLNPVEALRN